MKNVEKFLERTETNGRPQSQMTVKQVGQNGYDVASSASSYIVPCNCTTFSRFLKDALINVNGILKVTYLILAYSYSRATSDGRT